MQPPMDASGDLGMPVVFLSDRWRERGELLREGLSCFDS